MAKGYWIAHVDVNDPEGYKEYQAANAVAFQKYGGRFLVRGGASELPVGTLRSRHVIIEFKDFATALACYRSPDMELPRKNGRVRAIWTSSLSRDMTARSRSNAASQRTCRKLLLGCSLLLTS